jgi:predicted transcriptional regulator of viral defense system
MNDDKLTSSQRKAVELFRSRGGFLRASEAFEHGIQPRVLYGLRDDGSIELLARGVFRLKSSQSLDCPDLLIIAIKLPKSVVCLQSALFFHGFLKTIPQEVSVALCKGTDRPKIKDLKAKFYSVSEPAFSEGIQTFKKDGIELRVYNIEKTIVDCFKFRNKIGIEVCIDALQKWWLSENKDLERFNRYAKTCRIDKILAPYLRLLSSQNPNPQN